MINITKVIIEHKECSLIVHRVSAGGKANNNCGSGQPKS